MLLFALLDVNFFALIRPLTWLRPLAVGLAQRHLRAQVPEGALRDALTPRYEMGCKRVILSDAFYPALCQPNVALVTSPIERVTARGLRTADGAEHAVDVLVFATGFDVIGSVTSLDVRGAGGADLRAHMRDGGGDSYLGICVAGFPNFFMCLGPNTGLGHNSIIAMVECQARFMLQCMARAEAAGATAAIAPTAAAQRASADRVQAALGKTVWTSCASWYNQQGGRIIAMWPWTVAAYWWATLWPNLSHFEVGPAP
jgi:cation diffusion facilitator CzcD-associated flavoprotein CzcO